MTVLSRTIRIAVIVASVALGLSSAAWAGVSAEDGYAADGAYRVNVEIDPYVWLPAVNGNIKLGNGATVSGGSGVPTVSDLTTKLTGAFMGAGLVRYGPYSAEIDIQYVGVSEDRGISPDIFGEPRSRHLDASLVRVAPGMGYEVYKGALGIVPATLDARVGFAVFLQNMTLDFDRTGILGRERFASFSEGNDFVQPWAGFRADIYPWQRWRFEVGALAQGFGVGGGVWGWGASATATWAATDWLNLIIGFRALSTARDFGSSRLFRSTQLTVYGPLVGVGFTF
jgi:hypothetical protein